MQAMNREYHARLVSGLPPMINGRHGYGPELTAGQSLVRPTSLPDLTRPLDGASTPHAGILHQGRYLSQGAMASQGSVNAFVNGSPMALSGGASISEACKPVAHADYTAQIWNSQHAGYPRYGLGSSQMLGVYYPPSVDPVYMARCSNTQRQIYQREYQRMMEEHRDTYRPYGLPYRSLPLSPDSHHDHQSASATLRAHAAFHTRDGSAPCNHTAQLKEGATEPKPGRTKSEEPQPSCERKRKPSRGRATDQEKRRPHTVAPGGDSMTLIQQEVDDRKGTWQGLGNLMKGTWQGKGSVTQDTRQGTGDISNETRQAEREAVRETWQGEREDVKEISSKEGVIVELQWGERDLSNEVQQEEPDLVKETRQGKGEVSKENSPSPSPGTAQSHGAAHSPGAAQSPGAAHSPSAAQSPGAAHSCGTAHSPSAAYSPSAAHSHSAAHSPSAAQGSSAAHSHSAAHSPGVAHSAGAAHSPITNTSHRELTPGGASFIIASKQEEQVSLDHTQSGSPSVTSGSPSMTIGSPSITSDIPSVMSGAPSVVSGTPSVVSGTPLLTSGTPTEMSGAASVESGAPSVGTRVGINNGVMRGCDDSALTGLRIGLSACNKRASAKFETVINGDAAVDAMKKGSSISIPTGNGTITIASSDDAVAMATCSPSARTMVTLSDCDDLFTAASQSATIGPILTTMGKPLTPVRTQSPATGAQTCNHYEPVLPSCSHSEAVVPPCSHSEAVVPPCSHSEAVVPPCSHSEAVVPPCSHREVGAPPCSHSEAVVPPCTHREVVEPPCSHSEVVEPPCTHREVGVPPCTHREVGVPLCSHSKGNRVFATTYVPAFDEGTVIKQDHEGALLSSVDTSQRETAVKVKMEAGEMVQRQRRPASDDAIHIKKETLGVGTAHLSCPISQQTPSSSLKSHAKGKALSGEKTPTKELKHIIHQRAPVKVKLSPSPPRHAGMGAVVGGDAGSCKRETSVREKVETYTTGGKHPDYYPHTLPASMSRYVPQAYVGGSPLYLTENLKKEAVVKEGHAGSSCGNGTSDALPPRRHDNSQLSSSQSTGGATNKDGTATLSSTLSQTQGIGIPVGIAVARQRQDTRKHSKERKESKEKERDGICSLPGNNEPVDPRDREAFLREQKELLADREKFSGAVGPAGMADMPLTLGAGVMMGAHMRPWSEDTGALPASHYPSSWPYSPLWLGQHGYPMSSSMDASHLPLPPRGYQISRHPMNGQLILVPAASLDPRELPPAGVWSGYPQSATPTPIHSQHLQELIVAQQQMAAQEQGEFQRHLVERQRNISYAMAVQQHYQLQQEQRKDIDDDSVSPSPGADAIERKPAGFPYYAGVQPYPYPYPSAVYDPPPMLVPVSSLRTASPAATARPLTVTVKPQQTPPLTAAAASAQQEHASHVAEKHRTIKQASPGKRDRRKEQEKSKATPPILLKKEMKSIECQVDDIVLETMTTPRTLLSRTKERNRSGGSKAKKSPLEAAGRAVDGAKVEGEVAARVGRMEGEVAGESLVNHSSPPPLLRQAESRDSPMPRLIKQAADSGVAAIVAPPSGAPVVVDAALEKPTDAAHTPEEDGLAEPPKLEKMEIEPVTSAQQLTSHPIPTALLPARHDSGSSNATVPELDPVQDITDKEREVATIMASGITWQPSTDAKVSPWQHSDAATPALWQPFSNGKLSPWQPFTDSKASPWHLFADAQPLLCRRDTASAVEENAAAAAAAVAVAGDLLSPTCSQASDSTGLGLLCALAEEKYTKLVQCEVEQHPLIETCSEKRPLEEASSQGRPLVEVCSEQHLSADGCSEEPSLADSYSEERPLSVVCSEPPSLATCDSEDSPAHDSSDQRLLVEVCSDERSLKRQDSTDSIFSEGTHVSNLIHDINRNKASTPDKNMCDFIQQSCQPGSKPQHDTSKVSSRQAAGACRFGSPEHSVDDMDAMELDMRMRLAELQRRYKEKQRELSKLQPRRDKSDHYSSKRPGRPRKRKCNSSSRRSSKESSSSRPRREEESSARRLKEQQRSRDEKSSVMAFNRTTIKPSPDKPKKLVLSIAIRRPEPEKQKEKLVSSEKNLKAVIIAEEKAPVIDKQIAPAVVEAKPRVLLQSSLKTSLKPDREPEKRLHSKNKTPSKTEPLHVFTGDMHELHAVSGLTGLGLLAHYITTTRSRQKKEESEDEDDDVDGASASKKRKPGRPKKHSPDSDGEQTETIVAKKPRNLALWRLKSDLKPDDTPLPPTRKPKPVVRTDFSPTPSNKTSQKSPAAHHKSAVVHPVPATDQQPKCVDTGSKKDGGDDGSSSSKAVPSFYSSELWNRRRSERIFLSEPAILPGGISPLTSNVSPSGSASSAKSPGKSFASGPVFKNEKQETKTPSKPRSRQPSKADSEHKRSKPIPVRRPAAAATAGATERCTGSFTYDPYYYPDSDSDEPGGSTADDSDSSSSSSSSNSDFTEEENLPLSALVEKPSRPVTPEPRSCQISEEELRDGLRVLILMDGHFYPGYVTEIEPPDVYGVTIDGERGKRPYIYPREELLQEAFIEVRPQSVSNLTEGTRVCAYWSQQYRCLYPGTIVTPEAESPNSDDDKNLLSVEFDDGDSGNIPMDHIRLLLPNFPIVSKPEPPPILLFGRQRRRPSGDVTTDSRTDAEKADAASKQKKASPTKRGLDSKAGKEKNVGEAVQKKDKSSQKMEDKKRKQKHADVSPPKKSKHSKDRDTRGRHHHHHHHKKHKHHKDRKQDTSAANHAEQHSSSSSKHKKEKSAELILKDVKGHRSDLTMTIKTNTIYDYNSDFTDDSSALPSNQTSEAEESEVDRSKKSKRSVEKSNIAAFLPARQLWRWTGKSTKRPGMKGRAKKEFYRSITRGRETINVGDCAVFLSTGRPHLPYVGRVVTMWEGWGGNMVVKVKWFYHPEETRGGRRLIEQKHYLLQGALFQSPHVDENDVQTISHKCNVLSWQHYNAYRQQKEGRRDPYSNDDVYYLAGSYDPTNGIINFEPID